MTSFYSGFALLLLLSLAGGLVRVVRGPTRCDRLLAAQLLGTTGVAILLILAEAVGRPALRDVAILFALLAAFNVAVFFVRTGNGSAPAPSDPVGTGPAAGPTAGPAPRPAP